MDHPPIAAQMYTVREAAAQNLPGALERIAELGYAAVELAGLFGWKPGDLARTLNGLGLNCISAHVSLTELKNNLAGEIETYLELGAAFIVCPWLPPELRQDETSYFSLAGDLNLIGERCRDNGLRLCYHHHEFELTRYHEKYALDILLENSDPTNLQLEADTYWLKYGGEDPADYIRRWAGRIPLIHLKDMTATRPPTYAEVGTGLLNWAGIFEAAYLGQAEYYIVEQDICPGDPFDSLKLSLENLRQLGV
jgi:sugar phosphate isomerase/epimerase